MAKRLSALVSEIDTLRAQFLPYPFDPLGVYADSDRVQAHTRAFLVLSHAEIESYLEESAKELARASEVLWNRTGRISPPLAFLLASLGGRIATPASLSLKGAKDGQQQLADEIKARLFPSFYKLIKDNHGVKELNVLQLFTPLGAPSSAFTSTMLANLDSLGSSRGTHAHHSAKAVTAVLDPETEYKRLQTILNDFGVFEAWISNYRRRIR